MITRKSEKENEAARTNDEWCISTVKKLKEASPLGLKVSLRSFSSLGYRSSTQLIEVLATIWEKTAARIFRNRGMHKYSLGWKLLNDLKVGIQRHFMEADNTNTIAFLQKVVIETK
ncbi:hypothetical protein IFM89_029442 [Coptis chinensis]|uniref:Uncharacterized protein n=1 Tax=Coptis chinensis TaxID=261450 RepID=A0A835H6T1_9MAGN|nr:hypothetical protein IFM89_029442 [Coptis chinensis]